LEDVVPDNPAGLQAVKKIIGPVVQWEMDRLTGSHGIEGEKEYWNPKDFFHN
jgi:hypothetical protein